MSVGRQIATWKEHGFHYILVFVALMMLAFLVDQVQQLACELFQAVLEKKGSRKRLWEHMRDLFKTIDLKSMAQLFEAILYGYKATVVIFSPP
jgi:hypothetical protein